MSESTQPVVIQVAPADVDPQRVEAIGELAMLLLFGAVCIFCLRQLGKLFEISHEKD